MGFLSIGLTFPGIGATDSESDLIEAEGGLLIDELPGVNIPLVDCESLPDFDSSPKEILVTMVVVEEDVVVVELTVVVVLELATGSSPDDS